MAKSLSISYGNVTYHFKTKHELILSLYQDMLQEVSLIPKAFDYNNLFKSILEAPKMTFEISINYLFFYVDFIEIKRTYPDLSDQLEKDNNARKTGFLQILQQLQHQGILRNEFSDSDLDYLMDLSGAMRTYFFINLNPDHFKNPNLQNQYVTYVNQLVYPYLTTNGIKLFQSYTK